MDYLKTLVFFILMAFAIAWLSNFSETEISGSARAMDGDSLMLDGVEIRLEGIDAPELSQSCTTAKNSEKTYLCGREARAFLRDLIRGQDVVCTSSEQDKFDRQLSTCFIGKTNLNAKMVAEGWAVAFGRYQTEENAARGAARGIWTGGFTMPQQWRDENNSKSRG
ncbi:MAG: thermonuclease family protein [Pseudomonadota bacterium]